jgi:hypothetical protein
VTLQLRRFKIPDLRELFVPENSFHELHKPWCFEGDRFSWIPQQTFMCCDFKFPISNSRCEVCNDFCAVNVWFLDLFPHERMIQMINRGLGLLKI